MTLTYNKKEFYRAHLARDPRFDGKFFVAVKTTKIYCRPVCPARKAHLKNLEFFIHKAQAEEAGYRPCLRCRPETSPGSPAWLGTSSIVQRAIRLMDCHALEEVTVSDLAAKLGIGERWLRELFRQQVGAHPQSVLMAKKLDIAKNLLDKSSLPITEIAFSSGFQSVRRFNDAFKARFQQTPTSFRKTPAAVGRCHILLSYRPPYSWDQLIDFFRSHAITQLELVDDNCYQRLITYGDMRGWFKVTPCTGNKIDIEFKFNKSSNILEFITRLKNIFDLDADPIAIESSLQEDEKLQPFLKQYSGLRIAGCWEGFELAVRAVVGQRISVKGACTILGRIIELCGEKQILDPSLPLQRFFPTPAGILTADLTNVGLTGARITTLKLLAQEVENGDLILDGTADFEETCKKLLSIRGIGPWTVEYIAMRALRNPNSFPEMDLVIQKKIVKLQLQSHKWSPWRAYAAVLLWNLKIEDTK